MENVEALILVVSLIAAASGSIILLATLASVRARMVKVHNQRKQEEQRQAKMLNRQQSQQKANTEPEENPEDFPDAVMVETPEEVMSGQ